MTAGQAHYPMINLPSLVELLTGAACKTRTQNKLFNLSTVDVVGWTVKCEVLSYVLQTSQQWHQLLAFRCQ